MASFLLGAGASRQAQFDDFYKVSIDTNNDSISVQNLKIKEMDGFGGRHSIGAATFEGRTFLFGGQDVLGEKTLNSLHIYHHEKNELEQIEYIDDAVVPKPRNSHSTAVGEGVAYLFGGANEEGPLNDAYTLDL